MRDRIGKTVKFNGYKGLDLVGIIVWVNPQTRTGFFVGYLNTKRVYLDDIVEVVVDFNNNEPYETIQELGEAIGNHKIRVNSQTIRNSRMPKELGDEVRRRVKNIQTTMRKSKLKIKVDKTKQAEYVEDIRVKFLDAIREDADLGNTQYLDGVGFIRLDDLYFIHKRELNREQLNRLDNLKEDVLSTLTVFSQTETSGSMADYYAATIAKALTDYVIYFNPRSFSILGMVNAEIDERAIYPEKIKGKLHTAFREYDDLNVEL